MGSVTVVALLAAASVAVLSSRSLSDRARLTALYPQPPPGGARAPARGLLLLLASAVALLAGGPLAAALVGLGLVAGRRTVAAGHRRRQHDRERSRALEALAVLAGDLRSGRPPDDALAAAAEVALGGSAEALAAAAAAARLGGDVPGVLGSSPSEVPEVLRGLAACWTVCSSTGSGLAAGVERLEEGLRAAEAQRRLVDAELAGPRATAAMLAALPLAGLLLAGALGARPLTVLLHTPVGALCLVTGLGLDAAGLLWTQRLVARAGGS